MNETEYTPVTPEFVGLSTLKGAVMASLVSGSFDNVAERSKVRPVLVSNRKVNLTNNSDQPYLPDNKRLTKKPPPLPYQALDSGSSS